MTSLIQGYNYDIFISYRQKDNKHDGWVTEFVDNLKGELESTFKEEISVYFDINPSDYLLESYDVDESLKDKQKCLVFMPILSRTYCDPKAFAWEYEFKAFVEQASKDRFGLKIKLPNGNVASRVLPIQIHDLKANDKTLIEKVLGGFLRSIEFIYTEPGVNRPLTAKDSEEKNLNKTNYRNQINKVANAIEEIISALRAEPVPAVKEKVQLKESVKEVREEEKRIDLKQPVEGFKVRFLIPVTVAALLIVAGIIAYPKIFKRDILEKLRSSGERISVAVMPFQILTNDTTWNIYGEIVQINMTSFLSGYPEELRVQELESIKSILQSNGITNYAAITASLASSISRKLKTDVYILGKMVKSGNTLRFYAQLIESRTKEIIKSFQIEGSSEEEHFISMVDSLTYMVGNYLSLSKLIKEDYPDRQKIVANVITSPQAYKTIMDAEKAFAKRDFSTAIKLNLQAIAIDSTYIDPLNSIVWAYSNQGLYEEAKKWYFKTYDKKNLLSKAAQIDLDVLNAYLFGTYDDRISALKKQIDFDDQKPMAYDDLGRVYIRMYQYDKAIPEFEKVLEIYNKWGIKPFWINTYEGLGLAYHETGQHKKEKKLYQKAEKYYPNDPAIIARQAILSLSVGKTNAADEYINKYISFSKEGRASEEDIATNLARIYSEADILDKAEEQYRKAFSLAPESLVRSNNLAYFLIDKDRNIPEGLELVERALKSQPENYNYLDHKGWGLYKQGKYQEALNILQKSWDLRIKNAVYNHPAYIHLEAAKKAVENLK